MDFDVICFSTGYYDEPFWTNRQHLMSRLAHTRRVLYVEPGLFNRRYFKQLWRTQPQRLFQWWHHPQEKLWVLSPQLLPLYRMSHWLREMAWPILIRLIQKFCRQQGFKNIVLWTYEAEMVKALRHFNEKLVVYDCVDEFSAITYYRRRPKRREEFIQAEAQLIRQADVVITTSSGLYARKIKLHPGHVFLVENVGDFEHFHQATQDLPLPEDLKRIPLPRAGFFGAISEYKLDFGLLAALAKKYPRLNIVLIGPIGEGDRGTNIQSLQSYTNIHILGPRPYAQLPNYIKGFDVCLIPYQDNDYVRNVFPIKFFECLATGKPLVTSNLPALSQYQANFYFSTNQEQFIHNVQQALQEQDQQLRQKRMQIAQANTWDKRLESILCILQKQMPMNS